LGAGIGLRVKSEGEGERRMMMILRRRRRARMRVRMERWGRENWKCGWTNGRRGKKLFGEEAWKVVRRNLEEGGWEARGKRDWVKVEWNGRGMR